MYWKNFYRRRAINRSRSDCGVAWPVSDHRPILSRRNARKCTEFAIQVRLVVVAAINRDSRPVRSPAVCDLFNDCLEPLDPAIQLWTHANCVAEQFDEVFWT